MDARLVRAKAFLAIAESADSKTEAYKKASRELSAYKQAERCTYDELGELVGKKGNYVRTLVSWFDKGCRGETPFLADNMATRRAERSHARKMLADPEEAQKLASDPRVIQAISENPDSAAALMRLAGAVGNRVEETERGRIKPELARTNGYLTILTRLSNAQSAAVRSYEELQDMVLSDDELEKLAEFTERLHTATEILHSFVVNGGDVSERFAQLLKEGNV